MKPRIFLLTMMILAPVASQAQHRSPPLSSLSLAAAAVSAAGEGLPLAAAERPPLSSGRVARQVAAGVFAGVLGGVVLGGAMAALMADQADGWGGLIGGVLGAATG